ncbi:MAG: hypothetical protein V4616_02195 [Bacteroidota bacterium]
MEKFVEKFLMFKKGFIFAPKFKRKTVIKMKKFFSLVAVAAIVSLSACSNNASEEASTEMDSVATEAVAEPVEEVAPVADTTLVDTAAAPAEAPAAH